MCKAVSLWILIKQYSTFEGRVPRADINKIQVRTFAFTICHVTAWKRDETHEKIILNFIHIIVKIDCKCLNFPFSQCTLAIPVAKTNFWHRNVLHLLVPRIIYRIEFPTAVAFLRAFKYVFYGSFAIFNYIFLYMKLDVKSPSVYRFSPLQC